MLRLDHVIEQRDGYLVVRSPGNPTYYWGNLLLFDEPPAAGDAPRWEALFEEAFADEPRVRHRTFAWDRADGEPGGARGVRRARLRHRREHRARRRAGQLARIRGRTAMSSCRRSIPAAGADEELWDAVVELQVAGRDEGHDEERYRAFSRARLEDRRALSSPVAAPGTSPSTRRTARSRRAAAWS